MCVSVEDLAFVSNVTLSQGRYLRAVTIRDNGLSHSCKISQKLSTAQRDHSTYKEILNDTGLILNSISSGACDDATAVLKIFNPG